MLEQDWITLYLLNQVLDKPHSFTPSQHSVLSLHSVYPHSTTDALVLHLVEHTRAWLLDNGALTSPWLLWASFNAFVWVLRQMCGAKGHLLPRVNNVDCLLNL